MALKKLKKLYKTSNSNNKNSSLSQQATNLKTRLNASGVDTDNRNVLQKALNLEEDMGFLAGLGDVLERLSGLASIKAVIVNKDYKKNPLQNIWEGFTGEQRYSGVDVVKTFNPNIKYASDTEKFLAGLATDILLDPATYLTFGATAMAKNATKAGAKAVGAVDNLADLNKVLKTTKTADQASDIIKGTKAIKGIKKADRAQDLLKASKAYRTADVVDTIANPLKLVPVGAKKLGQATFKGIEKVSPKTADAITDLGKQFTKTFNYDNFLKKHLGEEAYQKMKFQNSVAEASQQLISETAGKQQKLLEKVFKNIKKDPDFVWETTSKATGKKATFSFAGMSDDEIMTALKNFANNQIYFDRPTVIDETMIRSLANNRGRIMLPVERFKNRGDIAELKSLLQEFVDDPDLVSISKYKQTGTNKLTGYVINIGEKNARTFTKQLDDALEGVAKQQKVVAKAQQKLLAQRGDPTVLQDRLNQALEQLTQATKKSDDVANLLKTRNLVPYDSPIINIPEMQDIAKLQKQATTTNLGVRNLTGMATDALDKYDPYIHRKLTEESRNYLMSKGVKNDPVLSYLTASTDRLPSQPAMTSIYGNFSPTEVNTMVGFDLFDNNVASANYDMVKQLNRKAYNTNMVKSLFTGDTDWVKDLRQLSIDDIGTLRKQGYEKYTGGQIAKRLKLSELIGEQEVTNFTKTLKGKNFLVSPDAIELFDKNRKLYQQLDSAFNQQLTKFMKYWKGGNLLSVGYHLRNIFGAQTNMALAGMGLDDIAKYTTRAGLDMSKYNTKILPAFREWILEPANATLFKRGNADEIVKAFSKQVGADDAKLFMEMLDAQAQGVWGNIVGQHDAVKRAIGEMPTSKLGQVADKVQDINYKLGSTADDINRLASYRWAQQADNANKVMKVGARNAREFVNYAMFDFKAMSPTEQAYFTKLFPFYNFIKNNLVFQFKNITKNAQRYNTLAKAYNNLYDAQGLTENDVQQYVKDQLYIPIRLADGTVKVLKVAPPVQDATNLLSLKNLLGASNPIIQYITDRAYGEDLYTGKSLEGDRTENVNQLVDLLPYGRSARTLLENPLSVLLPVSTTSVEKAQNQNAYAELEELQKLAQEYKKKTGQSLPTLKDLGL